MVKALVWELGNLSSVLSSATSGKWISLSLPQFPILRIPLCSLFGYLCYLGSGQVISFHSTLYTQELRLSSGCYFNITAHYFNIPRFFNNCDNSEKGGILLQTFIQGCHSCCFLGRGTPHLKVTGNSWQPAVLLSCDGSLPQASAMQGLKLVKPGACSFCRLALLQVLQALQLFTDCSGIRCALQ